MSHLLAAPDHAAAANASVASSSCTAAGPEQSLTCALCHTHLKDARVLPACLHSFCLPCLEVYTKGNQQFPCPLCETVTQLQGGLESLPANPYYNVMFESSGASAGAESDFSLPHRHHGRMGNGNPAGKLGGTASSVVPANNLVNNSSAAAPGSKAMSAAAVGPQSGAAAVPAGKAEEQQPWSRASSNLIADQGSWRKAQPNPAAATTVAASWKSSPFDFGSPVTAVAATDRRLSNGKDLAKGHWDAPAAAAGGPSWSSVIGSHLERAGSNGLVKPGSSSSNSSNSGSVSGQAAAGNGGFPFGDGGSEVLCSSCEEKRAVTSHCRDCREDLCAGCVDAHQRVKLTRDHVIVRYPEREAATVAPSAAAVSVRPQPPSAADPRAAPNPEVMLVYANAVEKAKGESERLLQQVKLRVAQIEEAHGGIGDMEAKIGAKHNAMVQEVNAVTHRFHKVLTDRNELHVSRLNKIRAVKLQALELQKKGLARCTAQLRATGEQLAACGSAPAGRELALIEACNNAAATLKEVEASLGPALAPQEDDAVDFVSPDPSLLATLAEVGFVSGSGFAPTSAAEGDGLRKAIVGKEARFIVVLKDQLGEKRTCGGDPVKVSIAAPDGRPVRMSIYDGQNGTYRVAWRAHCEGEHSVAVTCKDVHIQGSPFKLGVHAGRDYSVVGAQKFEFGGEGEADGQLCRPWGVACSKEGLILVANRSNNRIEVYTGDGKFHHKFGTTGKGQGQFDRPASVCCDRMNRAIIADKDNHRVQVFTVDGTYLMGFGEKGSKPGQFNYPWDVACNSKDQILVSDTRNHRIQLFSPNGEFVAKYGFEGAMWKHFDSPRGVCFTADDQPVVTDFNNHRLLVVSADFQKAQFLGKEGSEDGSFTRPNGVAVDEEGHIIVADSRNDRVQVFSSSGVFMKKFGAKGAGPGEFDRPSGVCISPEGNIIVVDFGNNRVQVF